MGCIFIAVLEWRYDRRARPPDGSCDASRLCQSAPVSRIICLGPATCRQFNYPDNLSIKLGPAKINIDLIVRELMSNAGSQVLFVSFNNYPLPATRLFILEKIESFEGEP